MGIEYLSSFLKHHGYDVSLLFDPAVFSGDVLMNNKSLAKRFCVDEKIIKQAINLKPDLIGFSAFTGNFAWCKKIAEKIKQQVNIPIVFGGVHTSAVPEAVLKNKFIDFAIIGEGEQAMLDLLKHLRKNDSLESFASKQNICFRLNDKIVINQPRQYIKNLDELRYPDKELFYKKVPMLSQNYLCTTSRGCPYACTYCSNNLYKNLYANEVCQVRRRSPENVIKELVWAKSKWNIKLMNFADDVFTSSKEWLERFIPLYKAKINLPFFCSVHPLTVTDDIVALLKQGNCWLITMGVQSGSERIRKQIFERIGSNDQIVKAAETIKKHNIKLSVDNIFAAPTETEEDLAQSLELFKKIKSDRILTFYLTYYPGTKIIQQAKEEGILNEKDIENLQEGIIGFTHSGGSVKKERLKLYNKYEILFQLKSLVKNDKLYTVFSKIFVILPSKKLIAQSLIFFNAMKNRDVKFWYLIKYMFSKKNYP